MGQGREILRRILIALGALLTWGFAAALVYTYLDSPQSDDRERAIIWAFGSMLAFYGWRTTVNWVLLYEKPEQPDAQP